MFFYGFDLSEPEDKLAVYNNILDNAKNDKLSISIESSEIRKSEMLEMYGGFLFLGIFLSILFIIATTLIIYYKQITAGNCVIRGSLALDMCPLEVDLNRFIDNYLTFGILIDFTLAILITYKISFFN